MNIQAGNFLSNLEYGTQKLQSAYPQLVSWSIRPPRSAASRPMLCETFADAADATPSTTTSVVPATILFAISDWDQLLRAPR